MVNSKKKKYLLIGIIGLAFLFGSFWIYSITKANSGRNRINVSYAKMTSVITGEGNFNSDGLNYDSDLAPAYSAETGYTPGGDANEGNRIVRSFDSLTYKFDLKISPKSGNQEEAYDNRTVNVTVDLSEEEAKYVSFGRNEPTGVTSKVFSFDGLDTYDIFDKAITLYVLGAPNGTKISPKFTIKESEDEDAPIVLGKNGETINYAYENTSYKTTADFVNYLPSVVSSKDATINFALLTSEDSQKATYDGKVGRYLTYVVGVKINPETGLKGLTMPTGDITYDIDFSQTGNSAPIFKENWGRLYGANNVEDISPIVVNLPYSDSSSGNDNNRIQNPGNMELTKKTDTSYTVKINGYNMSYSYPQVGADNNGVSDAYITTGAFTVFSPRTIADSKNDITMTFNVTNGSAKTTSDTTIAIPNVSITNVNKYYENSDYSLDAAFYDYTGSSKLANDYNFNGVLIKNGTGSTSKGTTLQYKTVFNYKKTLSDQGLKEVIKIDDNALRFVPIEDKVDYDIEINCGTEKCPNISKDDFEVKFLTGSFNSENYEINNISSLNLNDEDVETVTTSCAALDLSQYNVNQIQNLYGGPCIKAKSGVETEYTRLTEAKDDDGNEIPITKAIVQTKRDVKLPDVATVVIKFNVRVRNVTDITQSYQATAVASTSDYDNKLYYYSPAVNDSENSVCNPNNYVKTVYEGKTPVMLDDSLFGDSLRVVNFTSREEITVKNKNSDGSLKTNYNTVDNETITFNVKTTIEDNNQNVNADDEWYINSLYVSVFIPKELNYIQDNDMIQPESVSEIPTGTYLNYRLPYTKPNMKIPEIEFKTKLDPTLVGNAIPLKVISNVSAQNINGEEDNSVIGSLSSSFTIYATGLETVIVTQKVGNQGTVVEKDSEFSYLLNAYNNTASDIDDYSILDILPYQGDENESNVNGSYSVKIKLPTNLAGAKVYCSKDIPANIRTDVFDSESNFEECNLIDDYVEKVTAIRIDNIPISRASYMGDIEVILKPTNNKYSNKYTNRFFGALPSGIKDTSNKITVKVVSRKISGRVFIDVSGDGVKDGNEIYLENVAATLYSLDNDNALVEVAKTSTDKNGYYEFKDLDVGRYKVRFYDYNSSKYDLTLRYATEDTAKDSDAYKISDNGDAEISNKKVPDDPNGIRLTRTITSAENMDMGLIPKQSFGFSMRKYITKIDLLYNGSLNTTNYDNQSSVSITVRNSLNATAKVYYGIAITNTSTRAGYVNLVQEDIPSGMIFDKNYQENKDWFEVNGVLQSDTLSDVLIKPGETKYLQIALFMPTSEEARTFLNSASVIESTMYDPEVLPTENVYNNDDSYRVGDSITYAGVDWHVISTSNQEDNSQVLTLLADSGTISTKMGHTTDASATYKWSESNINAYINTSWLNTNTIDRSYLYDQVICDDASGLESGSYGGTMTGSCQSGIYANSKIRLLTLDEFTRLTESSNSDLSWLLGNSNFWLQNTDYVTPEYLQRYINVYGNSYSNKEETSQYGNVNYGILQNSVRNKAMYINSNNNINSTDIANKAMEVRPVITISTNNIVAE